MFVIKNDGERVAFDGEKIIHAIISAAIETEIQESEAENIAKEILHNIIADLGAQEEVSTEELREKVLSELETASPIIAEAWRKYEEGKEE